MPENSNKVLILRTKRCRKSDVVIRFLEEENIPFEVKYLETDPEAQRLAKEFGIQSSPGIIVNGQLLFNPYQLIEKCRIKEPDKAKQRIQELLES